VPDGSRPAAIELSAALQLPYREGLVKNRYVGRTFIMPNQEVRELSVRRKLNAMPAVFAGKRVLLVDDSIVRGTTMSQIVEMVRKAGAQKVYLASASPPVKYPNVYGMISALMLGFVIASPGCCYHCLVTFNILEFASTKDG
jgi:amidophosphoribosyltransferase